MTLLERYDEYWIMEYAPVQSIHCITEGEIRRALAVAQAVEEFGEGHLSALEDPFIYGSIMRRADELLECPTSVPSPGNPRQL